MSSVYFLENSPVAGVGGVLVEIVVEDDFEREFFRGRFGWGFVFETERREEPFSFFAVCRASAGEPGSAFFCPCDIPERRAGKSMETETVGWHCVVDPCTVMSSMYCFTCDCR